MTLFQAVVLFSLGIAQGVLLRDWWLNRQMVKITTAKRKK